MKEYMKLALEEAKIAYKHGDVPVGAVIVKNNKIISKAHNKKEKNNNATNHAEIIAINKACKKIKSWHLEECELYSTMEPCMMCTGAILQSRIKKISYSIKNESFGYLSKMNSKGIIVQEGLYKDESLELLKSFFKTKR
ncbi:MAG: nucleoside deaminase [Clostridium sp.]|nr:nucleoside deaminase [Clostridium sp.]MCM1443776.1 nucleoside deaminase [Candidatus Amulumruptor caecigallinarius]